MAFPKENLDLFELTDKTLEKINELGKVQLNHFDLSFHFSKDSNLLAPQLNFHLYIFEEEFGMTTYAKKYDTVDKMIKLLLRNMKSEYMYKDVREALVMTKIKNLKSQLYETIKIVKSIVASVNDGSERGVMIDIEEQRNNKQREKNGMPLFALTAQCRAKKIDITVPLASNASDWEQATIVEAVKQALSLRTP
ncbi:MAG: hypothetical protein AAF960_24145 [Bacteroidota bacterium]